SIQNAGGVRTDIPAGDITIGDAYTLLPFANTLTDLSMTGAEIKQVLNEAVDFAHAPDGYITFGTVTDDGRATDTFLDYAQSFVDYVKEKASLSKPSLDEYSTQSYVPPAS